MIEENKKTMAYIQYIGKHYLITLLHKQWCIIKKSQHLNIKGLYITGRIPKNLIVHTNKRLLYAHEEFLKLENKMAKAETHEPHAK